jgi:hypothetical protein
MTPNIASRLLRAEPLRRCELGECRGACCLYGAWVDRREAADILANVNRIAPHMPPGQQDPSGWFDGRSEPDEHVVSGEVVHTTVVDQPEHYGGTACVFLRDDHKCALQVAADAGGLHPWRFKPFYCILHPLDLDDKGRITLDETGELAEEPGSCLRPAPRPIPLLYTFEEELRYLLGDKAYLRLLLEADLDEKSPID